MGALSSHSLRVIKWSFSCKHRYKELQNCKITRLSTGSFGQDYAKHPLDKIIYWLLINSRKGLMIEKLSHFTIDV